MNTCSAVRRLGAVCVTLLVLAGGAAVATPAAASPPGLPSPVPPIMSEDEVRRIRGGPSKIDTAFCEAGPKSEFMRLGVRASGNHWFTWHKLEIETSWAGRLESTMSAIDGYTSFIAGYGEFEKPTGPSYMRFRTVNGFGYSSDWWWVSVDVDGECRRL